MPENEKRPKRTILGEVLPLQLPYAIQVFPIYACNFTCEYCLNALDCENGYPVDENVMSWEVYKKLIDDIQKTEGRIKMLRFAGLGEPLLHPQIVEMVSYACQKDVADSVEIITNGSMLTRELSAQLIKAGLSWLRVSLQGLSSEDYQKRSRVELDFANLVESIRYFHEAAKGSQAKNSVKLIDYMIKDEKQKRKYFELFSSIADRVEIEALADIVDGIDYHQIADGMKLKDSKWGNSVSPLKICSQSFYMLQVNPDGNIVPCCNAKPPCVLGNIKEKAFQDIWLGETYRAFHRRMLDGVSHATKTCAECTYYSYSIEKEDRLDAYVEQLKNKF